MHASCIINQKSHDSNTESGRVSICVCILLNSRNSIYSNINTIINKFAQYMVSDCDRQSLKTRLRSGMCDCLGSEKTTIYGEALNAHYSRQYCSRCGNISTRKKSGADSFADFCRRVLSPEDFQMLVNDFVSVATREADGTFAFMRVESDENIMLKYRAKLDAISDYMSEVDRRESE